MPALIIFNGLSNFLSIKFLNKYLEIKKQTKAAKEETRSSFLDDLKKSFEDIFNQRTISDLGKILLLASGAFALAKLSDKFQKLLVPVLDFIRNTLIPNLQELNKDILDSPTGYLGIGGAVLAVQAALKGFGKNIRK